MDKKMIGSCLLVLVLTTVGIYGVSFSNDSAAAVAVVVVAVVAVVVAAAATAVAAVATTTTAVAVVVAAAAAVAAVVATAVATDYVLVIGFLFLDGAVVTILVASWEKKEEDFSLSKLLFLSAVFIVALNPFVMTSRYHNLSQLERDKAIVTAIELKSVDGKVELGLPKPTSALEQKYLEQTLVVNVGEESHPWCSAIRCQEGSLVWYKLILEPDTKTVDLKFNHHWWDYKAGKSLSE